MALALLVGVGSLVAIGAIVAHLIRLSPDA